MTSGLLVTTLRGHRGDITDLCVSPDNKLFASSDNDNVIRLWNMNDYSPLTVLRGHLDIISLVRFRPHPTNVPLLASIGRDGMLSFWDSSEKKPSQPPSAIPSSLSMWTSMRSPRAAARQRGGTPQNRGGQRANNVPVGSFGNILAERQVALMYAEDTNHLNPSSLDTGEWNSTGTLFGAGGDRGSVYLWEVHDRHGEKIESPPGLEKCTEKGLPFISPEFLNQIHISPVYPLKGHTEAITFIAFGRVNAFSLLTLSKDGTARLWDLTKPRELSDEVVPERLRDRNVSTRAAKAFIGTDARCDRIYNLATAESFPQFVSTPDGLLPCLDPHSIKKFVFLSELPSLPFPFLTSLRH